MMPTDLPCGCLSQPSKIAKCFFCCDGIRYGCCCLRSKLSKKSWFSILSYSSMPSLRSFVPTHSLDSARIIRKATYIAHILLVRRFPQIRKSIIKRLTIFMIDLFLWPFSSNVKPCQFSCRIFSSINAYLTSSIGCNSSSYAANFDVIRPCLPTSKYSSFGIVPKCLMQTFFRKCHFLPHANRFAHPQTIKTLPCGCATCGCLCPQHSPTKVESLCARHGLPVVTRWLFGEVATLVALILVCATVGLWAAIGGQF
jgi:hypothetical protein